MTELRIYFHERPCGWLRIDNERMSFQYDEPYVAANLPALSVAMPLRTEQWPDAVTFPFFENLLPEGRIRHLLAENLGTADNNFTRMLSETGGDVAGALSILPPGQLPTSALDAGSLTSALSDQALGQVLQQIETRPFLNDGRKGMRLSLAGAQNKLPVVIDQQLGIHLSGQHLSTHILKPPSKQFPGLVENEYFCMRAAAKAGINVPKVSLREYITQEGPQDCYVIERYDRTNTNGKTVRVHQEDMCQILAVPSPQKYVQDSGPGFAQLFEVVRRYTRPAAVNQQELIRRLLFNMLIGNQDAHGKNFALLHANPSIMLAPAYDLVSTLAYTKLQEKFAMPVGHARTVRELDNDALNAFQADTGVNLKRQSKQLRQFLARALKAVEEESIEVQKVTLNSNKLIKQIVIQAQQHAPILERWLS